MVSGSLPEKVTWTDALGAVLVLTILWWIRIAQRPPVHAAQRAFVSSMFGPNRNLFTGSPQVRRLRAPHRLTRKARKMKRVLLAVAIAAAFATSANAATVELGVNATKTSVPKKSAYPVKGGGYAYPAPYTYFSFDIGVLNDAGVQPGYVSGPGYAKVDLIARTGSGDQVVASRDYWSGQPINMGAFLNENTIYFARVYASPAHGIAANTDSNTFTARAYLKHYPNAYHSSYTKRVTFSGLFSNVEGLPARNTVRVLIQKKTKSGYSTVATLRPNAKREYRKVLAFGALPAAYRVRVVPVGAPKRYVTVDEYRYCVAATKAKAAKVCKSVSLGVR